MKTFELHEITSLPNFRKPKNSKWTGTYSACILGVLLHCQRHDQLVARAQSEACLTWGSSIFSDFGIYRNFNLNFNLVVGPISHRNLHRQPLYHSTRLVKTHLLVELVFDKYVISMELRSFEKDKYCQKRSPTTFISSYAATPKLIIIVL